MVVTNTFETTGLISAIEPLSEGYSRITLQSTDSSYIQLKIVFFDKMDRKYDGRIVNYQEVEDLQGSLLQRITGEGIDLVVSAERSIVERFRKREHFIVRKEIGF